jgi:excisionase family DNA binding protein
MSDERLLTIEQAAERLQIGRTFAYGLIQRGELASIKLGRARRIPVQAIDEYVIRLTTEQAH